MKLLLLGINYAPEAIGIAVYTTEMCETFAANGHRVEAVTAQPYYPLWRIFPGFGGLRWRRTTEGGVTVTRTPLYVPRRPTGLKRLVHHFSFALASLVPTLRAARRLRPDVVICIAPSLVSAPVAWLAARLSGAQSWLHVQDFEVGAAFATGLIAPRGLLARAALAFERGIVSRFDRVSTISPEMRTRLSAMGIADDRTFLLRNWADTDRITPLSDGSPFRREWSIATPHVALYSGNIGTKQGIEIIVDVARRLADRRDLTFVICGQGPHRAALEARAAGLGNIQFRDLQPPERLSELLSLATIHLLPQSAAAADLVLPSKLVNMLASGRPVAATALPGTGLAREVADCGMVVPPGDAASLAGAVVQLADDPALHARLSANARQRAEAVWSRRAVLEGAERWLDAMVAGRRAIR